MDKLSVGVIGAGYWGPNLIRNFAACPLTQLAAVCDANPARLESVRPMLGSAKAVTSLDALLELPLEAVAIATPVSTHFPLARRCLEAGRDVLVEKPLAASAGEARDLVELADRLGRVLMVDHTYLFSNPVRAIKELIARGELGDLLYIDSVRINLGMFQRDVNVIWDLAPHDLSIIDYVLGAGARSIAACGCGHVDAGVEDIAYVNVDYGGRLMANVHVNWLSPMKVRQMIFAGTRKSLVFNELNPVEPIKVYDRGIELSDGPQAPEGDAIDQRRRLLVNYRSGDILSPHVEPTEALQAVVRHFVACVRGRLTPISDGRLGLRVVELLEAATQSIRARGARVELEHVATGGGNGETDAPKVRSCQFPSPRGGREAGEERQPPLLREPVRL